MVCLCICVSMNLSRFFEKGHSKSDRRKSKTKSAKVQPRSKREINQDYKEANAWENRRRFCSQRVSKEFEFATNSVSDLPRSTVICNDL